MCSSNESQGLDNSQQLIVTHCLLYDPSEKRKNLTDNELYEPLALS